MRSTTSWTIPQPTDVLSYAYLWHHEAKRGIEEGAKDQPVVVVISRAERKGGTELLVVPVTTKKPAHPGDGIEMPQRVKTHLGLDAERCWIMVTEVNRFIWPGPDVRPLREGGQDTPFYGAIPQKLFDPVLAAVIKAAEAGRLPITKRTE